VEQGAEFGLWKEAVNSQHGTGVGGRSHPRTGGYHLKEKGFSFILNTTHVLNAVICALKMLVLLMCIFSPLQVKNKPHNIVTKYTFFLGPISMVAQYCCTISYCVYTRGQTFIYSLGH
jgi:hypothetical protein